MNFFKLLKQSISTRKIQFDIVTIFVSLIIIFSIITTIFNYTRYRQDILLLSKEIMHEVGNNLVDKISGIKIQSELLAEATRSLITNEKAISPDNSVLVGYLLNVLEYNNFIVSVQIEGEHGNFLSAINLTRTFLSNPLPPGAKYAIRTIDRSGPTPTETWQYIDTNLDTIATESVSPAVFDLRVYPWYEETIKWPHIYWNYSTDLYLGNLVLTVAAPAIDKENKSIGVVSLRLSLDLISNYFSHQQIGKSGQVFVLDEDGNVFIPEVDKSPNIPESLIAAVYDHYKKTQTQYFILTANNTNYLTYVIDFTMSLETHWSVLIIAPQKDFIGPLLTTQRETLLLSFLMLMVFGMIVYFSSKHISNPIVELSKQVDRIQHFDFREMPSTSSHIVEIMTLDSSLSAMRAALRSFGRYVPKEIVRTLLTQGKEITLGGEKRDLVVMFTDITDFTSLSETVPLEKLVPALTEYFDRLSNIILQSEGTIDKFIGDGIMAFWGAPQVVDDRAYKACMAASQCLVASNQELKIEGMPSWKTRFGIHSGEVTVGNFGSKERLNYTVIGDVVNTASRLQQINKVYHTSIIISDTVKDKVWNRFVTRPLDFVTIRGKKNKLTIHELIGTVEQNTPYSASTVQIELSQAFTEAYLTFHDGKLELAKNQFSKIKERFPEDVPTQLYLNRIEEELRSRK